uniref:Sphingomyelin phosphodiesterase n=1 Tax=Rhabditophanes sp. KR3021 TaxID=114890 RepID=A0AC35U2V0_9BILA
MIKALFILGLFVAGTFAGLAIPQKESVNFSPEKFVKALQKFVHNDATKGIACSVCTLAIDGIRNMIENGKEDVEIEDWVIKVCKNYKIEQDYVCEHIVRIFSDEIIYVLERSLFTSGEICGAFVSDCGVSENPLNDEWPFEIPGNKPPVKPWPIVKNPKKTMRVLHLTDIHVDRDYAVGSEANCGHEKLINTDYFCCRDYPSDRFEIKKKSDVEAGYWGSPYNCDIPLYTFINALEHISSTEKFDYIIVTGDLEAHDIFDYTRDKTTFNMKNLTSYLNEYFPNTPIYQTLGNHEGVPMDAVASRANMDPEDYAKRGPQWLYNSAADAWKRDLPSTTQQTIKRTGSYATKAFDKLKIVSINTIYCSMFNMYNYLNQTDPDGTLAWLTNELVESEANGEKVHIITHIPAGDDYCLKGYSFNFYKIVNRFENTISAIFTGHTHNDHFEVFYDEADDTKRPTNVIWIAPSLTTYSFSNPAYRVYTIDGDYDDSSFTVLEAQTYFTELEKHKTKADKLDWKLEYTHTIDYAMPDLSPASFHDLIGRFVKSDALFGDFYFRYYRHQNGKQYEKKAGLICDMKSARSYDKKNFCPV